MEENSGRPTTYTEGPWLWIHAKSGTIGANCNYFRSLFDPVYMLTNATSKSSTSAKADLSSKGSNNAVADLKVSPSMPEVIDLSEDTNEEIVRVKPTVGSSMISPEVMVAVAAPSCVVVDSTSDEDTDTDLLDSLVGKWMIFLDSNKVDVDAYWEKVKAFTFAGYFGPTSKIATQQTVRGTNYVICIYTHSYTDDADRHRVCNAIRVCMQHTGPLSYKTDAATYAGLYSTQTPEGGAATVQRVSYDFAPRISAGLLPPAPPVPSPTDEIDPASMIFPDFDKPKPAANQMSIKDMFGKGTTHSAMSKLSTLDGKSAEGSGVPGSHDKTTPQTTSGHKRSRSDT